MGACWRRFTKAINVSISKEGSIPQMKEGPAIITQILAHTFAAGGKRYVGVMREAALGRLSVHMPKGTKASSID